MFIQMRRYLDGGTAESLGRALGMREGISGEKREKGERQERKRKRRKVWQEQKLCRAVESLQRVSGCVGKWEKN